VKLLTAVLLLMSTILGCGPIAASGSSAPAAPSDNLTFMAGYKPQANLPFVAVYVANDLGYFKENGLNVDIQHSTGQGEHLRLAATGQVAVTTATGQDVLTLAADPGLPLVSIALFGQRSDQAMAVKADSPIKTPKDFEGKTVGYKVFPSPEYLAMLKVNNVDRSKINEVSVGFDPRVLTEGKVDVYPVFRSNEPDILAKQGQPVRLLTVDDYNIPSLGLTYAVGRDTLEKKRNQLVRFLKATLAATNWIFDHPEDATDIVMRYAPGEDRDHQLSMLKIEIESAKSTITQKDGIAAIGIDRWKEVSTILQQQGAIARPVDVEKLADDSLRREALGLK
jgi:ABC-type nitrate/sulfonate/bicarbonate transport system substrate-binding protein